ncbi:MAG: 2-hydroxyacid dehydrogenase [Actinomycetota bacterium]
MTERPPVLVTRRPLPPVLAFLEERCRVTLHDEDRPIPRARLLAAAAGKKGLLVLLTDRIDEEVLDVAGPSLRVVANYAVGFDNVDVPACTARGVVVTNTPDVLTAATADLTWALILAAARRVAEGDRVMRSSVPWGWAPGFMLGREVTGATLGVVGFGRIGRAVAARARGFDMRVLYHAPTRRPEAETALGVEHRDLPALLAESDIVTVHVALTEETRHLFGAEAFAAMKPTAAFVNTSRGAVVDEAALAEALRRGDIAAAGLDVFEEEPRAHPGLLALENVVLTPHLGSATVETRTAMGMAAAENLVAALEGRRPPAAVNPEAMGARR